MVGLWTQPAVSGDAPIIKEGEEVKWKSISCFPNPGAEPIRFSLIIILNMGFKVIIVGGGPAGLGLAHCLNKAGIDYVVLERNEHICNTDGASLALWPHNGRIMDQLGLLEGAQKIDCNIKYKENLRHDGSILQKNNMMEAIGQRCVKWFLCVCSTLPVSTAVNVFADKTTNVDSGTGGCASSVMTSSDSYTRA